MTDVSEKSGYVKSSLDEMNIFYRQWSVPNPKAIIIIVHGMSEHSGRYTDFGSTLARDLGALVLATDHRAHGRTASVNTETDLSSLGVFKTNKQISKVDCLEMMATDIMDAILSCGTNQQLPILIFGHSMGSLIARVFMRIAPISIRDRIRGVVLSGVPTVPAVYERFPLLLLLKSAILIGKGQDTLHHFILDKFDDAVRKLQHDKSLPRGCFISSVREQVDSFNADPLCGQTVDLYLWKSIRSTLIALLNPAKFYSSFQESQFKPPILFISGKNDPVCLGGKTAAGDAVGMRKSGFSADEICLDSCLHEFLHETSSVQQKGMNETIAWLRSKL
jgi:alpha-beta hydrolase superfamily lysophospholipase